MRQSSHARHRSSSRSTEGKPSPGPLTWGGIATTFLLAIVFFTAPLVLGAARLWFELPLLGVVALLLFVQGMRLATRPAEGVRRQIDAIDLTVLLFTLYTIVRWLTSPTEYFSRLEMFNVVAYAGIFLTCRYGFAKRTQGLFLLWLLVVLGVFETGFGYYLSQHLEFFPFGPTEQLHHYYAPRWVGTYGCPNHYASLLVMAAAATLGLAAFSKLPWPLRIVLFYLAGMMMVGIFFSVSRGSWISLFAAIIALVIFGLRYGTLRWWVPVLGALFLVGIFVAAYFNSDYAQLRLNEIVTSIQTGTLKEYVRIQLAGDALRIANDHPFWGTGPATFAFVHPRYQDQTFAFKAIYTHDDYLNCLADYGIVGFGIALFFVAAVTLKFFRPLRADTRWQDRVLVVTGFMAWTALVVHSVFDFNLHIPANAFVLFALTGLGLRHFSREEPPRHWSAVLFTFSGRWLGLGLMVLSVVYGVGIARAAVSDIFYEQTLTRALNQPMDQSVQTLEKALTYDPSNAQALVLMGDLYRAQASREQKIEVRIPEGAKALEAYQKAYRANPLDDTIQARMGMTFDLMRRYPEAFFSYTAAIHARPYDGQFWYHLGNHYWQRGMLIKAEQSYLLSVQCPHGSEKSGPAETELRRILDALGIPAAKKGVNPLEVPPETEDHAQPPEPATTP